LCAHVSQGWFDVAFASTCDKFCHFKGDHFCLQGFVRRVSQSSVPTTPSKATPFQENGASGGLSQSDHHSNLLSALDRADVRNSSLEGRTASGDDVKDLVPQAVESLEFVANAETEETEKQMATPGSDREREAHISQGAEASTAADGDASLKYISLSPHEVDSKHQSPSSEGELAESCGSSHDENDTKQSSVDLLSDQVVTDERVESVECKFRAEENGTVVVDLLTVEIPHVEKPVVPVGPNVDSHGAETEKSTVATVKVLEQQQLPSPVDEKMPLEMPKVEDQLNEVVQTHNLLYVCPFSLTDAIGQFHFKLCVFDGIDPLAFLANLSTQVSEKHNQNLNQLKWANLQN
jgi:hypothetical protein